MLRGSQIVRIVQRVQIVQLVQIVQIVQIVQMVQIELIIEIANCQLHIANFLLILHPIFSTVYKS